MNPLCHTVIIEFSVHIWILQRRIELRHRIKWIFEYMVTKFIVVDIQKFIFTFVEVMCEVRYVLFSSLKCFTHIFYWKISSNMTERRNKTRISSPVSQKGLPRHIHVLYKVLYKFCCILYDSDYKRDLSNKLSASKYLWRNNCMREGTHDFPSDVISRIQRSLCGLGSSL